MDVDGSPYSPSLKRVCHIKRYTGVLPLRNYTEIEQTLFDGYKYLEDVRVGDVHQPLYATPLDDTSLSKRARQYFLQNNFIWMDHQIRARFPAEDDTSEYYGPTKRRKTTKHDNGYYHVINNIISFMRLSASGRKEHMRHRTVLCVIERTSNHPIRTVAGPLASSLFTVKSDIELVPGDVIGMYTGIVSEGAFAHDEDTTYTFGVSTYRSNDVSPCDDYEIRISALEFGNEMRYINDYHGYTYQNGAIATGPNVSGFEVWYRNEAQNVTVPGIIWIVTDNIQRGEEILGAYGEDYWYNMWRRQLSAR